MTAKNPNPVLTRADIESKIDLLRRTRIAFNERMAQRDAAVAKINEEHTPGLEKSAQLAQTLEADILTWAQENRAAEFGESKSLEFSSGAKIQFRLGNKVVVFAAGKNEKKVIDALKRRKLGIFIKVAESLDKNLIKSSWGGKLLPANVAKALGLRLEQEEKPTLDVPLATAGKEQA